MQVLGAACELAIPHFTSKSLFSVTNGAPLEVFHSSLRMLAAAAMGYAVFAAIRGALFSILNNRLSRQLR